MSIESTSALLAEVFPGTRISRTDYLSWLYEQSPFGAAIAANFDDAEGLAGHYAIVPLELTVEGAPTRAALSLNTAVHERARGKGLFVRLAREAYLDASARGIDAIVGVANANSTPGFLRRLEFTLVASLPATVLLPLPGRGRGRSAWADAPASAALLAGAEPALTPPTAGVARAWDLDALRWRLRAPGSRYALHRLDDALAVSTVDRRRGVPVAIVLKVFAAAPLDAASSRALVRTVCRFHRAPVALHAGFNERVAWQGFALPERLRDSPLNLIARGLPAGARFSQFEFLDFDAY